MRKLMLFVAVASLTFLLVARASLDANPVATPVQVQIVAADAVYRTVLAPGRLAFKEHVTLRSEIFGTVGEVLVAESENVARDQIVARIDSQTLQADVTRHRARMRERELELERAQLLLRKISGQLTAREQLFRRNLLDKETLDDLRLDVEIARVEVAAARQALLAAAAELEQALERLERTTIRSPVAGRITRLEVKAGETVIAGAATVAGSVLMEVADISEVRTIVHVDEIDIARVAIGQTAEVHLVAHPARPYRGLVKSIAGTARASRRGGGRDFEVTIVLPGLSAETARIGTSTRAEIVDASTSDTVSVPLQAVLTEDGRPHVLVLDGEVARRRPVALGLANDTRVAIVDGLLPGEAVVVGPFGTLRSLVPGERVRPLAATTTVEPG